MRALLKATPDRPCSGRIPLRLDPALHRRAAIRAQAEGLSLNQWIASAVAEKVGSVETAAAFLRQRAGDAKPAGMLAFLEAAPDLPPDEADRLDETG